MPFAARSDDHVSIMVPPSSPAFLSWKGTHVGPVLPERAP